jgi:hypothetical protein
LWGLADEHCRVVENPQTQDDVLDVVHHAASEASAGLVVYFAGHGLMDEKFELYLALPESDSERLHKAVRYDAIRREVTNTARRARTKVVLLDCCYSGLALGGMGGTVQMADQARIDGTYLMTATAETSLALAPPGEQFTAFTGALIDTLSHGIPGGAALIDMGSLYYHVRAELEARRHPIPQQRARNDGREIALVRNRYGRADGSERVAASSFALPSVPRGLEAQLRHPPRRFAADLEALRAEGRDEEADQLLAAAAASRPDEEAAAIIAFLRSAGRTAEADHAIAAAAIRPPAEVLALLDVLQEMGCLADADSLAQVVAEGPVEQTALVAKEMRQGGREDDFRQLLGRALNVASDRRTISLIGGLWSAGLRDDIEYATTLAVNHRSGRQIVALADELRTAGREETAFRLYIAAADIVAEREVEDIARLASAMLQIEQTSSADQLLTAAAAARPTPNTMLDLLRSLCEAGLMSRVHVPVAWAAQRMAEEDLAVLATALHADDRADVALELCRLAARSRQVAQTAFFVSVLRECGRPRGAWVVLDDVAAERSDDDIAELLASMLRSGQQTDAARVLRGLGDALSAAERLDRISGLMPPETVYEIGRLYAAEPLDNITRLTATLRPSGSLQMSIFSAVAAERPPVDVVALHTSLRAHSQEVSLSSVLLQTVLQAARYDQRAELVKTLSASGLQLEELVKALLDITPSGERLPAADWLIALRDAGAAASVERFLEYSANQRLRDVAQLAVAFQAGGAISEARQLLHKATQKHTVSAIHDAMHGFGPGAEEILFTTVRDRQDFGYLVAVLSQSGYDDCATRLRGDNNEDKGGPRDAKHGPSWLRW